MKIFCRCLLVFVSLNAIAQTQSGTLIVLNASQDAIVVAADSRSYSAVAQFDTRCKITALGNQLVFAASGDTAYRSTEGYLLWDSHTIAKHLFLALSGKKATQPMPIRIAKAWGKEVKKKFRDDIKRDGMEATIFGAEGNTLVSAVFAGFYEDSPLIVTLIVTYRLSTKGRVQLSSTITNVFRKPKAVILGRGEIATELFDGKSERAIQWRQSLELAAPIGGDPLATPAIEAVRFSIDHYPLVKIGTKMLPPIGGPVDAVELSRNGTVRWFARKENCPED